MQILKKTAAAFLTLSFVLTGCAQNNADKNDTANNSDTGNASENTTPANPADTPSTSSTNPENADNPASSEPVTMLLERDIPLPNTIGKKETVVSILLNGKQGIELFSHDKSNKIYQYILQNDKWKKQTLQFPDKLRESAGLDRLEMLRGEDGRYYAFYALSDETYHLEVTDDLHTFEELSPLQWQEAPGTKGYVIPVKVRVSENGVLCAILKYSDLCRMYDLKNGGTILGEFGVSSYKGLEICGNQLMSESIRNKGNFIYDIETQKNVTELDSILTNNAIYEMISPDEMYACNDNGIYSLSSGKWQLLVDSSLNSLYDPNFSWQNIRHVGERIYITFQSSQSLADGKYKEGFILKYYEYSTDLPKIDTTLTIWGLKENASVKSILAEFRKEHPTVQVVYEIASDTSGVMTTDDIIRQFNADIFAGNGPDLILMDGLHLDTYAQRGLLYDMGEDLAKIKSELLPSTAALIEENSYAVPLRISLPFIIGHKDVLDDSLENFLQKSSGQRIGEMTTENLFDICYHFYSEGLSLNKSDVTKEDLSSFLELCKKASESWPLNDSVKDEFNYNSGTGWAQLGTDEWDFTFSYAHGLNQFCDMLDSIDQLTAKGFDYHSAANSFVPQAMLAVSQQSENIELSMEFVQMALSARLQESDLSDGFPVNTQALDSWADRHSGMMMAVSNFEGNYWDTQWPSREIIKRFLQSIKEADNAVFIERYTEELVKAEAVKVISGDTTAEDAAGRILNQLELYYDE